MLLPHFPRCTVGVCTFSVATLTRMKNMDKKDEGWEAAFVTAKIHSSEKPFLLPFGRHRRTRQSQKSFFFPLILCDHPLVDCYNLPLLLAFFNTFSSFFFFFLSLLPSLNALPFSLCAPLFEASSSIQQCFSLFPFSFHLFLFAF